MAVSVFIDNNAWDYLFSRKVDLAVDISVDDFVFSITREAEFEIRTLPEELKVYVTKWITCGAVTTDTYFGFAEANSDGESRVGGFDCGRFIDLAESEILSSENGVIKDKLRPTGLYKNEADVSLAARSVHSVILTSDTKKVLGRVVSKYGGIVVNLALWPEDISFDSYMKTQCASFVIGQ
ncbi:hypothetical protein [Pseudomonas sp. MWU13-2105]|uniref:hypothetical protein n=1 Tax=Pseudomonas sp. MWU13-2105 TaxID=2935074 RepID=UPI00200E2887|nr:hypothetical protein [Pseudomonas sp. MWU13-2105]